MKQLFRFSLLLLALLLPATATAHDFEVDGIYYNINGNEVSVTYKGTYVESFSNEYSGSVTIPSTVTYNATTYFVTSIGKSAFNDCTLLTSVVIPNSVTEIGFSAFEGCTGLTSIEIPNSVTIIGYCAFWGCSGLTSIVIPNSVTSIGDKLFYDCRGLTSVTIPNSVISIGDAAFWGCSGLTSIVIPNSVTSIGDYAFGFCTSLTSIDIPNSVTTIGKRAFYESDWLNDVYSYITDPTAITMGDYVFERNLADYDVRTLHVPLGSVAAYQADTRWSQYFGTIVEMEHEAVPAESIKLNVTTAGLNEGSTLQLTATVLPENCADKTVLWSSNNPSVATVDSNGLVTTHSVGTATITAMTTDGSNLSTTCTVTLLPVGIKGDVNGDSNISISDVTKLIDYLLSGHW